MNTLKTTINMILDYIKHLWELCLNYKGRRLDKELLSKIPKVKKDFKGKMKPPQINGIRVSYNHKFVLMLKKKEIKETKKKLNEQIKKEKVKKENLDKLLKMKPKEYISISKKRKG